MTRWWIAGVLALAGCNDVLGLHDVAGDGDLDGDGIDDSIDNCPHVPNPDQADRDGDGIGDACDLVCDMGTPTGLDTDHDGVDDGCDPCVKGPQQDEDGDGVFDGCDVCPGEPDPQQRDTDGDGVGELCDPNNITHQRRVLFDGFHALDDVEWQTGVGWAITDRGITPSAPSELLRNHFTLDTSTSWSVELGLTLPTTAPTAAEVGIRVDDGASFSVECLLRRSATGWELAVRTPGATTTPVPVTIAGPSTRLRMYLLTITGEKASCDVTGNPSLLSLALSVSPASLTLFDQVGAELTYVDAVE